MHGLCFAAGRAYELREAFQRVPVLGKDDDRLRDAVQNAGQPGGLTLGPRGQARSFDD